MPSFGGTWGALIKRRLSLHILLMLIIRRRADDNADFMPLLRDKLMTLRVIRLPKYRAVRGQLKHAIHYRISSAISNRLNARKTPYSVHVVTISK